VISFVVPTLNEAKTIDRTLATLRQYAGAHEIIVSDGGSDDGTLEICRASADHVLVYSGQQRQTIGMARNMGAAVATGEHLVFVDADVVIPDVNEFFEVAHEVFRVRPRLVGMTVKYRVFPELATFGDRYVFTMLGLQFFLQNNVLRIGAAGGEFQMIARDAFERVGGFNERLAAAEDMDLFRRLSKIGQTRFVGDLTVFHTGRRAHAVGWPRLLWSWFTNSASVFLFRRSASKEWKEIR
jgi:glycosyltransferase involved in cell wall biosynthesis